MTCFAQTLVIAKERARMTSVPEDQLFHELEQRYLSLSNEHELLLVDNRNTKGSYTLSQGGEHFFFHR